MPFTHLPVTSVAFHDESCVTSIVVSKSGGEANSG
jgi:hypothetical protein